MILSETYTLKDSLTIPKFGLGTWLIDDKSTAEAVRKAISFGYRLIDTAQAYGNERGVGEGVRTASVPREDIFVTSKIAAELKDYESASKSIDETLNKMSLDYIDMMLIHSPQPWKKSTSLKTAASSPIAKYGKPSKTLTTKVKSKPSASPTSSKKT